MPRKHEELFRDSWHLFLIARIFYPLYQEKASFDVIQHKFIFNLLKFDKTDWHEQKISNSDNSISWFFNQQFLLTNSCKKSLTNGFCC